MGALWDLKFYAMHYFGIVEILSYVYLYKKKVKWTSDEIHLSLHLAWLEVQNLLDLGSDRECSVPNMFMRGYTTLNRSVFEMMICVHCKISTGYCAWRCRWICLNLLQDISSSSCRGINVVAPATIRTWRVFILAWQQGTSVRWSRVTKRWKIVCTLTSWECTSPVIVHHGWLGSMLMLWFETCSSTEGRFRTGRSHKGIKAWRIEFSVCRHGTALRWYSFDREFEQLIGERIHSWEIVAG